MRDSNEKSISTFRRCIAVFSKKDREKIGAVIILQIFLGALDLLGVMLIGIIGALAVTGIQSANPGDRVSSVLTILHLQNLTFQEQTAILGIAATLVLIGRTFLSVLFTRKVLFFIGRRSAVISKNLIERLFQQNILKINSKPVQETIYATTNGVTSVTLGVVGTSVTVIADVSLLLVMALGLFIVDPVTALIAFLLFAGVGFALFQLMHKRATKFGKLNAALNIRSNERIAEVLTSYREATVRNRRGYYSDEIGRARLELSNALAELNFMPTISKYVIEGTMVIGAISLSALQFVVQDSKHAVATLAVFLAAGTRIAPAILRVQQGAIAIKSELGSAQPTLDLLAYLEPSEVQPSRFEPDFSNSDIDCRIKFENVSFRYPNSNRYALNDLTLEIDPGSTVAVVGPSGSGKTTLVDLLLGMFSPTKGEVSIGTLQPLNFISKYPGAIGYVPQDVVIIDGTIRENIAMGFPIEMATDSRIGAALEAAHLVEFVEQLPNKFDCIVGPKGSKLSGGQRQRLGIARALFTVPKLLVLDESTSALDAQTEFQVSNAISAIPYPVTKVVIAHRLSTVKNAEKVLYIDNGIIKAEGTFNEIRQTVPDFNIQAELMGID